jgi:hypothetical protein
MVGAVVEEGTVAAGPTCLELGMVAPAAACPGEELEGVPHSSGGRELTTGVGVAVVIRCGGRVWESPVAGWGMSYLSVSVDTSNPLLNTLDSWERHLTTSPYFIIAKRAFLFAIAAFSYRRLSFSR